MCTHVHMGTAYTQLKTTATSASSVHMHVQSPAYQYLAAIPTRVQSPVSRMARLVWSSSDLEGCEWKGDVEEDKYDVSHLRL